MMHALRQNLAVARIALKRIFASPLAGLLNILVIGIALSLPAGVYLLLQNAQGLIAQLSGPQQISLFLSLDVSSDEVARLRKQLELNDHILSARFISRSEALESLKKSTGLEDVIAGLDSNPLPDAYVITPKQNDAKSLEALRDALQRLPKVDQAQLDSVWAYKLDALLEFARIAVLILASLLSIALVAVTFNTIRLQILTQRDEIQVSQLIGATNSFIRRPFLYFGATQGLLGGLAAWLIITIGIQMLKQPMATLSRLYGSDFSLHALSAGDSLALIIFSAYLGLLGAWLSVSRHL